MHKNRCFVISLYLRQLRSMNLRLFRKKHSNQPQEPSSRAFAVHCAISALLHLLHPSSSPVGLRCAVSCAAATQLSSDSLHPIYKKVSPTHTSPYKCEEICGYPHVFTQPIALSLFHSYDEFFTIRRCGEQVKSLAALLHTKIHRYLKS